MKMISRIGIVACSFFALGAAPSQPDWANPGQAQAAAPGVKNFSEFAKNKKNALDGMAELIAKSVPVIVKFSRPGCGPCIASVPAFHELAVKYGEKAIFVSVDTAVFDIASKYEIRSVPTFVIFNKGKRVAQFGSTGLKKEGFAATIETELKKLKVVV